MRGHIFILAEQPHLLHSFFETGSALIQAHPKMGEFVGKEGPAEANFQSATGDGIQHAQLTGDFQWVVEPGPQSAGNHLCLGCLHSCCGKEHDGARTVATVGLEIVLDSAHRGIT